MYGLGGENMEFMIDGIDGDFEWQKKDLLLWEEGLYFIVV